MFNKEKFIDMSELSTLLKSTDTRTATKWCNDNGLTVFTICRKKMTYRFLVEIELDKMLIKQLKKTHPENWEVLYQCYRENNKYEYIKMLDDEKIDFKPNSIPKSDISKEFVKQLKK